MTAAMLLDALRADLEGVFEGFALQTDAQTDAGAGCSPSEAGELPAPGAGPIRFFLQNLPAPEMEDAFFPFVILRCNKLVDMEGVPYARAEVALVIGVYDPEDTFQGYRDVMNMQEKIRQRFLRDPLLDGRFVLEMPLECYAADDFSDVTYPYFYGGVSTVWRMPNMPLDSEEWV
jgi:hypothetical protein